MFKNISRDLRLVNGHAKCFIKLKLLEKKNETVGKIVDAYARKNPNKICFYYEDEKWTFGRVSELSNQVGNYFMKEGFKKNDVVALYMENRPEHICTWLGLSKIGVIGALVNYNLRSTPLKRCFDIAKAKAVICGYEHDLSTALAEIHKDMPTFPVYASGTGDRGILETAKAKDLDTILPQVVPTCPSPTEPVNFFDDLCYIFTSGTTGFPKAAIIKQSRFMLGGYVSHFASELTEDDVIYMTLPIYHAAGLNLAVTQSLIWGTPMIIRKQFSASNFWKDCIRYNATAAQYIAETCRFLLRQPPSPEEKQHKVNVMFGNGLRAEIKQEFRQRFNIERISEFYASTEGNANMINVEPENGAVGFIPTFLEKVYPMNLIRVDPITEEPIRDPKTGLVVKCKPNELGELVGKIIKNSPFRDFKGYAGDEKANAKKTLHNVFENGDSVFRTGDLFIKDEEGFYYFKDRMGDGFRWKSENVSTAEVEYVISNVINLRDVVVFGVPVPGYDGQAGMAAIADPDGTLDLNEMEKEVVKSLPPYARPLFVRIVKEIEMTGTHKMKKTDLQTDGYDLSKTSHDKMYFLSGQKYILFTKELHEQVMKGDMRL